MAKRNSGFIGTINNKERASIVQKLKMLVLEPTRSAAHTPSLTDDEVIRVLAGRRIFMANNNNKTKGMWIFIQQNSLFGFLYGRNYNYLSNIFSKLETSNYPQKQSQIEEAKLWEPTNYSVDKMVSDWKRFDVNICEEAIDLLKELHRFDLEMYEIYTNKIECMKESVAYETKSKELPIVKKSKLSSPIVPVLPISMGVNEIIKPDNEIFKLEKQVLVLNNRVFDLESRLMALEEKANDSKIIGIQSVVETAKNENDILEVMKTLISKMNNYVSSQPVKRKRRVRAKVVKKGLEQVIKKDLVEVVKKEPEQNGKKDLEQVVKKEPEQNGMKENYDFDAISSENSTVVNE